MRLTLICLSLVCVIFGQIQESCETKRAKDFVFVTRTPPQYKKVVEDVLKQRGFAHNQVPNETNYHAKYEQDVIWGQCSWLLDSWFLRTLKDHQRCANFPHIHMLVWKTNIQWHIHNNKVAHKELDFSFWPPGYNLEHKEEYEMLENIYINHESTPEPRDPLVYIVKNPFKNAGSGIHLISSKADFDKLNQKGSPMYPLSQTKPLAQRYVHNPLLIAGHKTTFRVCYEKGKGISRRRRGVWVLITSLDPLTVYRFDNGPVKFGGHKYRMGDYDDHDIHVASWTGKTEDNIQGESIQELEKKLNLIGGRTDFNTIKPMLENELGFNLTKINQEIDEAILGTIFSSQPHIYPAFMRYLVNGRKHRLRHFEMVGYDILLDEHGKPYVLEVNLLPDLRSDTPILTNLVNTMLHEMFDILDIEDKYIDEVRAQTDLKWDGIFTRLPMYEKLMLNFPLTEIMNWDEMFTFVNDEYELERSQKTTGWRRLCPLKTETSSKFQDLSINPRDKLFQQWYDQGLSLMVIPKKEDVWKLLIHKADAKGNVLSYTD